MKYKITHNTTYEYGGSVPVCQNMVHLTPRDGLGQKCTYHRLTVKPTPSSSVKRVDYFGNITNYFSVTRSHKKLSVLSSSTVDVDRRAPSDLATSLRWEDIRDALPLNFSKQGLEALQFCFASPRVPYLAELARYASESLTAGRPMLVGLKELTERIHADFTYDPKATTVSTPVSEVFELRRGVCQDLAHLQISCLRSLGLAARYVSGYLRTVPPPGKPRLVGAEASHAWLSVYCGERGWVDVDPTNNVFPSTDHITVAWGRDYDDVCPIRGMFIGAGEHKLRVSVDVVPVE